MLVTFNCTLNCGLDGSDWDMDVDVTEEEYERLKKAEESGKTFWECEEVRDIYMRVYDMANESATEDLKDYDEDFCERYEEDESLKADDLYSVNVHFSY
jgi:hypothetical protein